jgi:tripartite motif-containing protein 71
MECAMNPSSIGFPLLLLQCPMTTLPSVPWPPVFQRGAACSVCYSLCVSLKHGLVAVAENRHSSERWIGSQIHMYSLADGTLVRSIGCEGSGKGQFNFWTGGLSVTPDAENLLVADCWNNRVQEVRIADGSWVRSVDGEGTLRMPMWTDCNAVVIAVSEACHRVSVLSWSDGGVLAQFGSQGSGPGQLSFPYGLRLLANSTEVVIADCRNNRLSVFKLNGEFVKTIGSTELGLASPIDVVECGSDGSFIVANNHGGHNLMKLSGSGEVLGVFGKPGSGDGEFNHPSALAVLPFGGLIVRDSSRFQVFGWAL